MCSTSLLQWPGIPRDAAVSGGTIVEPLIKDTLIYKGYLFRSDANTVMPRNKRHLHIKDNFHGPSVSFIQRVHCNPDTLGTEENILLSEVFRCQSTHVQCVHGSQLTFPAPPLMFIVGCSVATIIHVQFSGGFRGDLLGSDVFP